MYKNEYKIINQIWRKRHNFIKKKLLRLKTKAELRTNKLFFSFIKQNSDSLQFQINERFIKESNKLLLIPLVIICKNKLFSRAEK